MQVKQVLHIVAGYKNSGTFLKHLYAAQPFKIAVINEGKPEHLLRLMMTSSSPGILDNDHYEIEINVEEKAQLHLTTQGYQRLFSMKKNASQLLKVHAANGASFFYLPHPVVPHKDSDYSAVNNIFLKQEHNLIWLEILTCGRKLSGEEFTFTRFHSVTNIYLNDKLVVKENVLFEPLKMNVHAIGQLEGFTHQSTLLFLNNSANIEAVADACKLILNEAKEILTGISKLPTNGLIIRLLGYKAEELFDLNKKIAGVLQQAIGKTEGVIIGSQAIAERAK